MPSSIKTATQFSGLSTYPNTYSGNQPGALQLASNIVIDRQGEISPRRGQPTYSAAAAQATPIEVNLLPYNVSTAGELGAPSGILINAGSPAAVLEAGQSAFGSFTAPTALQGANFVASSLASNPTSYGALTYTIPCLPSTWYVFSALIYFPSSSTAIFKLADDTGTTATSGTYPSMSGELKTWIRGFVVMQTSNTAATLTLTIENAVPSITTLYSDAWQLELGTAAGASVPSPWQHGYFPVGNVPTRMFQATESMYAFYTQTGLPSALGYLARVDAVNTTAFFTTLLAQPPGNGIRSFQELGNTYISTDDGIYRLTPNASGASPGILLPAGVPYALDTQAALAAPPSGAQGFLQGGFSTAYQIVWGYSDANGIEYLGAPSPAVQVANPLLSDVTVKLDATSTTYANTFTVTLPFTANATNTIPIVVSQGSTNCPAKLILTNGSSTGQVLLQPATGTTLPFFGPASTAVGLTVPFNVLTVTTSTTLDTDTSFSGLGVTSAFMYQPYVSATPGSLTGAAVSSTVSSIAPTGGGGQPMRIIATGGTWNVASGAYTVGATVATAQPNALFLATTATVPQIGDELVLLSVAGVNTEVEITGVTALGGSTYAVTLASFPAGMVFTVTSSSPYAAQFQTSIARSEDVTLTFTVPAEIETTYAPATNLAVFYQVYRSTTQQPITGGVQTAASTILGLAYQATVTSAQLAALSPAHVVMVTDITPDGLLGAHLYTGTDEQGALAAQYPPPVASDMCLFNGVSVYADCFLPASTSTQLLAVNSTAVGGLQALQPGDLLFVNGIPFLAQFAGSPAASGSEIPFAIVDSASNTVTENVNETVANLVRAVNTAQVSSYGGALGEIITALSTSTLTSAGGNIVFQVSRGLGAMQLSFVGGSGSFAHPNPFTSFPTNTLTPSEQRNSLYYSPVNQPDAVPLDNNIQVGTSNYPIQRILALPSSLLIFKPDGIYQLTGATSDQFSVQQFNTTARLIGNETAVLLSSSVLAYTTLGVVTITSGGVQIVSQAIHDDIQALQSLPAFVSTAFGIGDDAETRYLLYTPVGPSDVTPQIAYAYNLLTNSWTRWATPRVCGLVNVADALLYTGAVQTSPLLGVPAVYQERAITPVLGAAYGDEQLAIDGSIVVLTLLPPTTIQISGLSTGVPAAIVAQFPSGSVLTVNGVSWPVTNLSAVGPGTIQGTVVSTAAINVAADIGWGIEPWGTFPWGDPPNFIGTFTQATAFSFSPMPISGDDPGTVKQFQEFVMDYMNYSPLALVSATCQTEMGADSVPLSLVPFGQTPPAQGVVPAPSLLPAAARQLVTRQASRGRTWWLNVSGTTALGFVGFSGLTLSWTALQTIRSR